MNRLENEPASSATDPELPGVVVPLLKGVVYQETDPLVWGQLLHLQPQVRDYVRVLDLELILDEAEGYAFLRSREPEEADSETIRRPRLVARRQLSFPVSLLLALLRKKLAEFDATGGDTRLVMTREEMVEMLRLFLPEGSNEARLADQVETHLNRIVDLGFLRRMKVTPGSFHSPSYEVRRIIKAFIDAQWLSEFDGRLDEYRRQCASLTESSDAE
jgi:hypothetical protein